MKRRLVLAAATLIVVAACSGASPDKGEIPVGTEPMVVAPATPSNASYYVNRARDVAGQADARTQELESQQP